MRHAGAWRVVFICYALLIGVLTHWPGMTIEAPVARPDLFIHASVFGLWTILFARTELLGIWGSWRAIGLVTLVSSAYAGLDEWTQQFVRRHTAIDDFLANILGVVIGTIVVAFWSRRVRRLRDSDNTT